MSLSLSLNTGRVVSLSLHEQGCDDRREETVQANGGRYQQLLVDDESCDLKTQALSVVLTGQVCNLKKNVMSM